MKKKEIVWLFIQILLNGASLGLLLASCIHMLLKSLQ